MTPDALARLHAASFAPERPWSAEEFATLLALPGALLLGNERASLLARVIVEEAEVLTLATHPAHRRQGLARGLLLRFHETAAGLGAARAVLEVAEGNAAARALYEDAGYEAVGRRPAYYARPDGAVAALVMARALP